MKIADLLLCFVTVHAFVTVPGRLLKGYQIVHLKVDFSARAQEISITGAVIVVKRLR